MTETQDGKLARLERENALLKSESRLLHGVLDNAPLLISAKDLKGNILFANQRFALLDGPSPGEYVGRNVFELFPRDIAEELWQNDLKAQRSEEPVVAEESVYHRNGELHTYQTTKFRLFDHDNNLFGTCAISTDISRLKQLQHDAFHDYLTGLHNHRYFAESLERDLARAQRAEIFLIVALIDLDNFKQVNDRFGHDKGNEVLISVAKIMLEHFHRPDDVCIRVGGDEFAVVFAAGNEHDAINMLNDLHAKLNKVIAEVVADHEVLCTNSIGVKIVPSDGRMSFRELYTEIDKALYHVKRTGKNSIYII